MFDRFRQRLRRRWKTTPTRSTDLNFIALLRLVFADAKIAAQFYASHRDELLAVITKLTALINDAKQVKLDEAPLNHAS